MGDLDEKIASRLGAASADERRRAVARLGWLLGILRLRWWVWALAFGPPLALGFYGQATFSGPQRWLGEWQLRRFGAYTPTLVGAVVAGIAAALWTLPAVVIALSRVARSSEARPPGATEPAASVAAHPRSARDVDRLATRLTALILGAVPLVWGAVLWIMAARTGPLREVDAAQLERGEDPPGSYLRIIGRARPDRAVIIRTSELTDVAGLQRPEERMYVPVVSAEWSPEKPVAAFVVCRPGQIDDLAGAHDPVGTLEAGGLGPAATFLERDGLRLAGRRWVVELGNTPHKDTRSALILMGASLPLGLFAWLLGRWQDRRRAGGRRRR